MLERVLEPEVMDSREEARQYDTMDHSQVNRAFVDDLIEAGPITGEILDLGTGTAQIPIELCPRLREAKVWAIDRSGAMLEQARANVVLADFMDQIHLEFADAKKLDYDDGRFAAVISNSIVHHLAEPVIALCEALRVLASQGLVFFRDLFRPPDEATLRHLVDTYAAEANDFQRQMFENSLRAALTVEEMRDVVEGLGFARQTVAATSDRHWTWTARKP